MLSVSRELDSANFAVQSKMMQHYAWHLLNHQWYTFHALEPLLCKASPQCHPSQQLGLKGLSHTTASPSRTSLTWMGIPLVGTSPCARLTENSSRTGTVVHCASPLGGVGGGYWYEVTPGQIPGTGLSWHPCWVTSEVTFEKCKPVPNSTDTCPSKMSNIQG